MMLPRSVVRRITTSTSTVPVIATRSGVSLAEHLDLRNLPLATTPGGRVFAMKALHPSDQEIKTARVPGESFPSLSIAFDTIAVIPIPEGKSSVTIVQNANPALPVSIGVGNGYDVPIHDVWYVTNSSMGYPGLVHNAASNAELFGTTINETMDGIMRYRVTAQSVTATLVAPTLTNQGNVTSWQATQVPQISTNFTVTANADLFFNKMFVHPELWIYDRPMLDLNNALLGTNAYTAPARDGVYQPLKLDSFDWVSGRRTIMTWNEKERGSNRAAYTQDVTADDSWPYLFRNDNVGRHTYSNGSVSVPMLDFWNEAANFMPPPSSKTVGVTLFSGLQDDGTVSVRLRIRQIVEVVPYPSTTFAPLVEAPLPPDYTSIQMVKEIAARMKDGYPASYNDLDKLRSVIGKIGKGLLDYVQPVLGTLGRSAALPRWV